VEIRPDTSDGALPVTAVNVALADAILAHSGKIPLIFASDCTSALGAMKGLERRKPAVVWYDAHGDFNTPQTSPSGFLGGMPLAMLVGRGQMGYMNGIGLSPIQERDVVLTDARDLDPDESLALRQSRVVHLREIDDLLTTSLPDRPLYIHMDLDVVDPAEMPGLWYPTPGGPSVEAVNTTLKRVVSARKLAGALFSLWNNSLVSDDRSLQNTLTMVRTLVQYA
jgi:arginase